MARVLVTMAERWVQRVLRNTELAFWVILTIWIEDVENAIETGVNAIYNNTTIDIGTWILSRIIRPLWKRIEREVMNIKTTRKRKAMAYRMRKRTNTRDKAVAFAKHMAMSTTLTAPDRQTTFDTDSFQIAIDNCCSRCITNDTDDFISPPETININVSRVGGQSAVTKRGTVRWRITDDDGRVHTLTIPNTYYSTEVPYRLLSPQHWAQEAKDTHPNPDGTVQHTYRDRVVLKWQQQ